MRVLYVCHDVVRAFPGCTCSSAWLSVLQCACGSANCVCERRLGRDWTALSALFPERPPNTLPYLYRRLRAEGQIQVFLPFL